MIDDEDGKTKVYKLDPDIDPWDNWRWRLHCPRRPYTYEYKTWADALADAIVCGKGDNCQ